MPSFLRISIHTSIYSADRIILLLITFASLSLSPPSLVCSTRSWTPLPFLFFPFPPPDSVRFWYNLAFGAGALFLWLKWECLVDVLVFIYFFLYKSTAFWFRLFCFLLINSDFLHFSLALNKFVSPASNPCAVICY